MAENDTLQGSGRPSRERKQREVVNVAADPVRKQIVVAGDGSPLSELTDFVTALEKLKSDDDLVKQLHMLLFDSVGKSIERKKHLRQFAGFAASEKVVKLARLLDKKKVWTVQLIKRALTALGVQPSSGTREEIGERLLDFLQSPSVRARPLYVICFILFR